MTLTLAEGVLQSLGPHDFRAERNLPSKAAIALGGGACPAKISSE